MSVEKQISNQFQKVGEFETKQQNLMKQSPDAATNQTGEKFNVAMQDAVSKHQEAQERLSAQKTENLKESESSSSSTKTKKKKVPPTSKTLKNETLDKITKSKKEIEAIKERLKDPNAKLKNGYEARLQKKIKHIDDNLRVAMNHANLEFKPAQVSEQGNKNPLVWFLDHLTDGQQKLDLLSDQLGNLKEALPVHQMLAIQIKVQRTQHQIEFFGSLLGKALESIKTVMSVQV